ncbi:hypothetical protein [Arthrobacter sp. ISL-95]|uniref:hypothetical protein n=1 Tax=Arthrobacter sp. ISL-95 TaxID=2819116 RepID=UPI001BE6F9ED|nr:hypothetical protein [Arthrobacter sp. ISL-95]MBT2587967.1 hypothetical protein [Arthrobacter sp. ISL-95]
MTTDTDLAISQEDFYLLYSETARRIAIREHRQSTIYDVSDVEQAIWEHVFKKWSEYRDKDEKLVYVLMRRAARSFAERSRIDSMYANGTFIYTPSLVATYLETCAWEPLEEVPDVDARVDLVEAFELLRASAPKQAAAVFNRYALKETSEADRKNAELGVDNICHRLNSGLRLQSESVDFATSQEV